jgi:signal transduction histidine kinase
VNGDDRQLKQAFFHLIENACQAMKGKGTLILRASSLSKNGSHYIKVEVEDTGKGIYPEDLHHIFNPFYTTKTSSLGLGLPIVHKIITSHRGQIEVDNHPGEGVNFIITLPAREEGVESLNGLS